jgi:hypothetical protein
MATEPKRRGKKVPPPAKRKPAGKAPGKKRKAPPKRTPVPPKKGKGNKRASSIRVATPAEVANLVWLRRVAEVTYVTSEQPLALTALAQDPMIKGNVSLQTLTNWCGQDNWVEQRENYFKGLSNVLKNKIATTTLEARYKMWQKIQKLIEKIFKKLEEDAVEAKSYEGLVAALVKVIALYDDFMEKIGKEIVPENLAGATSPTVAGSRPTPRLTSEEATEMAMTLVKRRQQEHLASLKEIDA